MLFLSTYYGAIGFWMERTVTIHYVDKGAFMHVEIVDNDEEVLNFLQVLAMRRLSKG